MESLVSQNDRAAGVESSVQTSEATQEQPARRTRQEDWIDCKNPECTAWIFEKRWKVGMCCRRCNKEMPSPQWCRPPPQEEQKEEDFKARLAAVEPALQGIPSAGKKRAGRNVASHNFQVNFAELPQQRWQQVQRSGMKKMEVRGSG